MPTLGSLTIERFRCFSKMVVSFDAMNVIIGPHGSGKTSILDAITIAANANNPALIREVHDDDDGDVRIESDIAEAVQYQVTATSIRTIVGDRVTTTDAEELADPAYAPRRRPVWTVVTVSRLSLSAGWDELVLTPKETAVLETLQLLDPRIARVGVLGSPRRVCVRGTAGRYRLKEHGLSRLCTIAMGVVLAEDGTVLIDTIEQGFDSAVITAIGARLRQLAERYRVQVIATTKSDQWCRALDPNGGNTMVLAPAARGRTRGVRDGGADDTTTIDVE